MELDTLGDTVLLTEATVIVALLFWFSRDSPKRRRTACWVTLGLIVAWIVDHL